MRDFYFGKITFVFVILFSFLFMMWGTGPSIAGASGKKPVKIGVSG